MVGRKILMLFWIRIAPLVGVIVVLVMRKARTRKMVDLYYPTKTANSEHWYC